jgi:hypothetical protein
MRDFSAFTAWGQVYHCVGARFSAHDAVDLRDLQAWVLLRSARTWRRIQLSSDLQGAAFAEDYAQPTVAAQYLAYGIAGTSVMLRPGYNFHFWPNSGRVSLRASDVVAYVVAMRARLRPSRRNGRQPCLVLSVGADLWRSLTAPGGYGDSGDVGIGRFKRVKRRWRLFTMTTAGRNLLREFPLPLTSVADERF